MITYHYTTKDRLDDIKKYKKIFAVDFLPDKDIREKRFKAYADRVRMGDLAKFKPSYIKGKSDEELAKEFFKWRYRVGFEKITHLPYISYGIYTTNIDMIPKYWNYRDMYRIPIEMDELDPNRIVIKMENFKTNRKERASYNQKIKFKRIYDEGIKLRKKDVEAFMEKDKGFVHVPEIVLFYESIPVDVSKIEKIE